MAPAVTRGRRAPAVKGAHDAQAALQALLRDAQDVVVRRTPRGTVIIEAAPTDPDLQRSAYEVDTVVEETAGDELEQEQGGDALDQIADHLFSVLRGDNHLVFGGSRRTVEALSDEQGFLTSSFLTMAACPGSCGNSWN